MNSIIFSNAAESQKRSMRQSISLRFANSNPGVIASRMSLLVSIRLFTSSLVISYAYPKATSSTLSLGTTRVTNPMFIASYAVTFSFRYKNRDERARPIIRGNV